jgi:hypothetical protein
MTHPRRSNNRPKKKVQRNITRKCISGKLRYRDKQEADYTLRVLDQTSQREVIASRSYLCELCQGWHLTHEVEHNRPPRPPPRSLILKADKFDRICQLIDEDMIREKVEGKSVAALYHLIDAITKVLQEDDPAFPAPPPDASGPPGADPV